MTTRTIAYTGDTGLTLYLRVYRMSDGKVFDFDDEAWEVLASATTPYLAMSSLATIGGGFSQYSAELDLETINATMTPVDIKVFVYLQDGGSPSVANDQWLAESSLTVVNGELLQVLGSEQIYYVDVTTNYTTTLGTEMHLTAELKRRDGRTVDLATSDPTATCSIEVTMDATTTEGERTPVFTLTTTDVGSVNSDSQFEVQQANPNLTSNRGFKAKAIITTGGVAYEGDAKFNT